MILSVGLVIELLGLVDDNILYSLSVTRHNSSITQLYIPYNIPYPPLHYELSLSRTLVDPVFVGGAPLRLF